MQKAILLFFLSLSNPIFDFIANISSFFGEQGVLIILIGWILYAKDKKKGFAIIGPILVSSIVMSSLKAIVRAPRPFQTMPEIEGKRISTATGYSFPSGHTTVSSSMYSSIAIAFKKKRLSIICAIIIILVATSRMYLGVHWPIDVFGGLIIGIPLSIILYPVFYKIAEDSNKKYKTSIIIAHILFAASLLLTILLKIKLIDATAFTDFLKTTSMACGAYYGFALETKTLNYNIECSITKKIIRLIILVAISILIISGLKILFGTNYYIGSFVRYSLVGLFLTYLFPLFFKRLFE